MPNETIISIQPYMPETEHVEGYKITTSDQEILLFIDNQQDCCEDWGYFMSEDDFERFIGSSLLGVEIVDTARSTRGLPLYGLDSGEAMFVDIRTSRGVLQFVAYNSHNGYYGHDATVVSTQLTHSERL